MLSCALAPGKILSNRSKSVDFDISNGWPPPLIAPSGERVWEKFSKEGGLRGVEEVEKNKVIWGLEKGPRLWIDRAELMLWSYDG